MNFNLSKPLTCKYGLLEYSDSVEYIAIPYSICCMACKCFKFGGNIPDRWLLKPHHPWPMIIEATYIIWRSSFASQVTITWISGTFRWCKILSMFIQQSFETSKGISTNMLTTGIWGWFRMPINRSKCKLVLLLTNWV